MEHFRKQVNESCSWNILQVSYSQLLFEPLDVSKSLLAACLHVARAPARAPGPRWGKTSCYPHGPVWRSLVSSSGVISRCGVA